MKSIKYLIQRSIPVRSPDGGTVHMQSFMGKELQCEDKALESAIEIAKTEAYNGEYTIENIPDEPTEPTQLDRIEAQTTYTAMMTDTLLEEV